MPFRIKSFIASNGERFSQLYASETPGFPLFYPTAYIARSVRLNVTHETQKVYLEAIKRLCEWEVKAKVDLEIRFQRRDFLRPHEIDDLTQHLRAARKRKQNETISGSKGNTYVAYTADYLLWLANEIITDSDNPSVKEMITTQNVRLKGKAVAKTDSEYAKRQKTIEKCLPDNAKEQLFALWNAPFEKTLRTADKGSRLRNAVMLRILYQTGMRRGELLSLKLKNFIESTGGTGPRLIVERNHNDD